MTDFDQVIWWLQQCKTVEHLVGSILVFSRTLANLDLNFYDALSYQLEFSELFKSKMLGSDRPPFDWTNWLALQLTWATSLALGS